MRRQGAMRRQGMCRHNALSGGPGSSPMCRHNASSASAPNVRPKLRGPAIKEGMRSIMVNPPIKAGFT